MNGNVFVPPSSTVIDDWGKLGNVGWNWDTLRPYYSRTYSLKPVHSDIIKHLGLDWMGEDQIMPSGPI